MQLSPKINATHEMSYKHEIKGDQKVIIYESKYRDKMMVIYTRGIPLLDPFAKCLIDFNPYGLLLASVGLFIFASTSGTSFGKCVIALNPLGLLPNSYWTFSLHL